MNHILRVLGRLVRGRAVRDLELALLPREKLVHLLLDLSRDGQVNIVLGHGRSLQQEGGERSALGLLRLLGRGKVVLGNLPEVDEDRAHVDGAEAAEEIHRHAARSEKERLALVSAGNRQGLLLDAHGQHLKDVGQLDRPDLSLERQDENLPT